jgi:hypothetical protein
MRIPSRANVKTLQDIISAEVRSSIAVSCTATALSQPVDGQSAKLSRQVTVLLSLESPPARPPREGRICPQRIAELDWV